MQAMAYNTDIERLNYYEGEYLGAVDFEAEQEYHRDMRRRHNLGQHTWGIVTGLDLAQPANGATNSNGAEVDVYLQPGMAVDGFGREIVVLSQFQLLPSALAAFYSSNSKASPVLIYIWIAYQQQLLQPPTDACATTNVSNAYGRVEETYTLTATATTSAPPSGAIVVDGTQITTSSSSSSSTTVLDPPPITLPLDNSVPFQEFSTDDSTLVWWLPLGRVMWDQYNQVFLQIVPGDPVNSAISAAYGREYVGNVSAETYAPAGMYAIVDRNSPYPPQASTSDPNLGGVQAEVAGSLQVDFLLNAEMSAVIGGAYDPNAMKSLSPLTIVATSATTDQQLIQFLDYSNNETWYINQEFDGKTLGLNIGEVTIVNNSPKNVDNRIFIQPTQTNSSLPSLQNVGIGSSTPRNPLAIRGQGAWWELLSFEDNTGITKWHMNHNPQGKDAAGNPYKPGLNFCETGQADFRLFLQTGGNVGIGTPTPVAPLDVQLGPIHVGQTTNPTLTAQGAYLGWNLSGGTGETDFINNQGLGSGGFAFINTPNSGSPPATLLTITGAGNVGIGTTSPQQNFSVNVGLNIDQENTNPGGKLPTSGANKALTFGSTSGEGIGSCRVPGGVNTYGLDFYTAFLSRMNIDNTGAVTIGAEPAAPLSPAPGPGTLTINGIRTNLIGVDAAGMHWIMAGGTVEGVHNAIGCNPSTKQLFLGNGTTPWEVTVFGNVNGTKVGYVADRFINRDGVALERGDVVVLHSTPSSQYYGANARVPLVEVQLTEAAMDTRVCGIVDEPSLADVKIGDLDRAKLGDVQVGLMVTLGAYAFCKVDADIAPIVPGDLLITSTTPGYAQKLSPGVLVRPGAIIGKALGALKRGKGLIPVLFSHQ
jgi:hypothetical protein